MVMVVRHINTDYTSDAELRIQMRFSNGKWYKGTLLPIKEHDELITVKFDDGTTEEFTYEEIRHEVWIEKNVR